LRINRYAPAPPIELTVFELDKAEGEIGAVVCYDELPSHAREFMCVSLKQDDV
jgi:hypothetical protein